jgi:hypothetical protein
MIKHNLKEQRSNILEEMAEAALKVGRRANEISLMAVSKLHPYEEIHALYELGQTLFGENRVQETQQKFPIDRPEKMNVHLIGHLQSNKAKKALELFDCIDSVDSLKLARKLESLLDRPYPILLELKTAEEETKSGFPNEKELLHALDEIAAFKHLRVKGLMTIGPLECGERETRSAFNRLYTLYSQIEVRYPEMELDTLSMGMSSDFRWAIAEGSTLIRVGTKLFGQRIYG